MQQEVDLMVEDHHDLAQELSQFIPVILFDYPYNRKVKSENIMRVSNWSEAQQWIAQLNRASGNGSCLA